MGRADPTEHPYGYAAELKVECAACGERFRWIGAPAGVLSDRPACSVDEYELRAPLRPATADADFGMGIPGFSVTMRLNVAPAIVERASEAVRLEYPPPDATEWADDVRPAVLALIEAVEGGGPKEHPFDVAEPGPT